MYAHVNMRGGGEAVVIILAPFQSGEYSGAEISVQKNLTRGQRMQCLGERRESCFVLKHG